MLDFERKYNKQREKNNKRVLCFWCHKEWHSIQSCFKLFPKNKDSGEQQNRRPRPRRDGKQGYKKEKAMQAVQHTDSDYSSGGESNPESEKEKVINLVLMATHDNEASSSSTSKVCQKLELNDYECNFDLTNNCESIWVSNIFLNQELTIENKVRPIEGHA